MSGYVLTLDDFREVFTGGLTPGGYTAEEFDAALKSHDEALFDRAAGVALSVDEYGHGSVLYTMRRYPVDGVRIARAIRALSASSTPEEP